MPSPFSFQPPTGGNVVLKSCEGTVFNAHSVVLGLASTVFAGMFSGASSPNKIELAEDAETISLMLAFVYPVAPPKIATAAQLEKVMIFSQKYDITKMIDIVEKSIPPESELIHSDPIQVFRASVKYEFPTLRVFAGRAVRPKHTNLLTISGVVNPAGRFPEASSAIGIIGAQTVRQRILPRVVSSLKLPRVEQAHQSNGDDYIPCMVCRSCWDKTRQPGGRYTPSWFRSWIRMVESRLIAEPMHKCEDAFSILWFLNNHGWTFGWCNDCTTQILAKRLMFEEWVQAAKKTY
ncbi:hypothetical protein RHS03_02469, partial [Rhizoctonia solani]